MKRLSLLLSLVFAVHGLASAQDNITDSVDALNYDIRLGIGNLVTNSMQGTTTVTLRILQPVDSIGLELCGATIDSVLVDGLTSGYSYSSATRMLQVPSHGSVGDTVRISVAYSKGPTVMPHGWGGFYFDRDIAYNLGIAIYEYPHNVGKAWFPCRDNFYDHATYDFAITARQGRKAICTGMPQGVDTNDDGSTTWHWSLRHPTPTYLVGVAVADFHLIECSFQGAEATYPGLIGFIGHDSTRVWNMFANMEKVIPALERCFGPYRWDRVGYVSTPMGSMEHVGNIAFTTNCMSDQQEGCLATMGHEFAHSWFGNLVTCSTSENMWINEGGASFCEELAVGAIFADSDPDRGHAYARANLSSVLMNTHRSDGDFLPVYGPDHDHTYGSTVYNKGATVWHSLRGYMGDTLFYGSMRKLFDRHAFKNIDSYQLRDSLSLYSGMDLTDFFNFHVFGAGFVDYVVDSLTTSGNTATLALRQKTYGTDARADGNRVWVSFFSRSMQRADRLVTFDGESTVAQLQLPFEPICAIPDYDDRLSKASLCQRATLTDRGRQPLDDVFFVADVSKVPDGDSINLFVSHHWGKPDSTGHGRFLRFASRYWTVDGRIPEATRMTGRFYFARTGANGTLDKDFIQSAAELDQVRLLYRENGGRQWRAVSGFHTDGSGDGYFVHSGMATGQYTLAIIDTNYVDIIVADPDARGGDVRVFPNPTSSGLTIETDLPGEPLSVSIVDMGGRTLMGNLAMRSGDRYEPMVPSGEYILRIFRLDVGKTVTVKIIIKNN